MHKTLLAVSLIVVAGCEPKRREYPSEATVVYNAAEPSTAAGRAPSEQSHDSLGNGKPPVCPPVCPACPECPSLSCPPSHMAGTMVCDEIDPVFPSACDGFMRACSEPHCPALFPYPMARDVSKAKPPSCMEGGAVACHVPGVNNHIFIDCCSEPGVLVPKCVTSADCPTPLGECMASFCDDGGLCRVTGKSAGTPCGNGDACFGGFCGPG